MDNQEKDISLVEEYNQQGRVLYSLDKYEEAIPNDCIIGNRSFCFKVEGFPKRVN